MPAIEYLDDLDGFIEEVLDVDMRPEVRIQGRGRGRQVGGADGPTIVEATMVLTHYQKGTDVIRECAVAIGTAPSNEKEKVEELRGRLNEVVEKTGRDLANKGAVVKAGRWVR